MKFFHDLFSNYWLISIICSWLGAQILKVFTGIFRQREFSITAMLFGNGGMPSSHTAAVAGLATSIALTEGVNSIAFAIAALFSIIVMTDAIGVRRETGKHSKLLNEILVEYKTREKNEPLELFRELIGHSPLQVFFGLITGIAVALLLGLIPAFNVF